MDKIMYQQLAAMENIHWWFIGRKKLIEIILASFIKTKREKGIDLGCGTGGNLKFLKKYCHQIIGFDLSSFALRLAKQKYPKDKLINGDINRLRTYFPANSFDLITIFGVLYHQWIKKDPLVLKQVFQLLKPGGLLLLTEPAFSFLTRKHDLLDQGKKRYCLKEMENMLKQAGFIVRIATYFNSIAFLPVFFLSFINRLKKRNSKPIFSNQGSKELFLPPNSINQGLIKFLEMEGYYIKYFGKIPVGINLLCLVQKPFYKK